MSITDMNGTFSLEKIRFLIVAGMLYDKGNADIAVHVFRRVLYNNIRR